MSKRFSTINKLKPLLTNYWGERIVSQILYLEEINNAQNGIFEQLLNETVAKLDSIYAGNCALTRDSNRTSHVTRVR